jgi:hypothetical protein
MKKLALVLFTALLSLSAFAVDFAIKVPNIEKEISVRVKNVPLPISVADFTAAQLNNISSSVITDFTFSESGEIVSVNGSGSTIIPISNGSRHFGWCYTVNGVLPDFTASEMMLKRASDSVRWFYGYIDFQNGKWGKMCLPAQR